MKIIVNDVTNIDVEGNITITKSEDICKKYGLDPWQTKRDTVGVNYSYIELPYSENMEEFSLAYEIDKQINEKWVPMAKKNLKEKMEKEHSEMLESKTFMERLKYLFTGEIV